MINLHNETLDNLRKEIIKKDILLENIKTELDLRVTELYSVVEACTLINSVMKLDDLLNLIMEIAAKITKAEASSLFLIDDSTQELYIPIAHGEKESEIKQVRIPIGKGIAGWVAKHNRALKINDPDNDSRFFKDADKKTKFKTRNILAVPLIAKDKTIGAVEVLNKVGESFFNDNDVTLLTALSNQAAICIENVRLYEDVKNEKIKIETIVSSMGDGVIVTDEHNDITLMNPAAEEYFYTNKKNLYRIDQVLSEVKTINDHSTMDMVFLKPDSIILSNKITPLKNSDNEINGHIMSLRNITESKQKENATKEYLAILSHKLIDPIEKLKKDITLEISEQVKNSIFCESNVKQLERIEGIERTVRNLMYFTNIDAGPLRISRTKVDINKLITNALDKAKRQLEHDKIEVETKVKENLPIAFIDIDMYEETFVNLIAKISTYLDCNKNILIEAVDDPDNFIFNFKFTTKKIKFDELFIIFDKELQIQNYLDNPDLDFNLDLAFVKHIMDAHGGKIKIKEPNENEFVFEFKTPKWDF